MYFLLNRFTGALRLARPNLLLPSSSSLLNNEISRSFIRTSSRQNNYEGDGKTTAVSIDADLAKYIIVDSYNEKGFRLSNGAFAYGPIIMFPNVIFQVCFLFLSVC